MLLGLRPGRRRRCRRRRGEAPTLVTPAEKNAAETIRAEAFRADIRFLVERPARGRGPASTRGRAGPGLHRGPAGGAGPRAGRARAAAGPAVRDGGRAQPGPGDRCGSRAGGDGVDLRFSEDYVAFSGTEAAESRTGKRRDRLRGLRHRGPRVRVGRLQGRGPRGKVLLMMNNDPEDDPSLFAGKTRLYYGRWGYKYEQAARLGAAGAHHHPHDAFRRATRGRWCRPRTRARSSRCPATGRARAARQGLDHRGRLPQDRPARRPGPRRAARRGREARLQARAPGGDARPDPQERGAAEADGQRDRPAAGQRPRARGGGRALHRAPRPPGHEGRRASRGGRDLQRRPGQRHGGGGLLLRGRGDEGAAPGPEAHASTSRRWPPRSRACSARGTWPPIRRCPRAASPPTSTWTASTSWAARGT